MKPASLLLLSAALLGALACGTASSGGAPGDPARAEEEPGPAGESAEGAAEETAEGSAAEGSAPEAGEGGEMEGGEPEARSEVEDVRVLDADGAPLSGAEAVLLSPYDPLLRGRADAPLRADREGRIAFGEGPPLPPESQLLVWAPGSAAARFLLPARAPEGGWAVRLPRPAALRGRVTPHRGEGGAIRALWLQAEPVEGRDPAWVSFVRLAVDEEGRFRAEGLAPGRYHVAAIPIGLAPVLGVDEQGRGRFVATEPTPPGPISFRMITRELEVDGSERELTARFGRAPVAGQVLDEEGRPIEGAAIALSTEGPFHATVRTDARGVFEAEVPPLTVLRLAASHPGYGIQWSDRRWRGWSQYDAVPEAPITLRLRRGVILRGRLLDEAGRPVAGERLLMIPAYVGSGPATLEARTDAQGRFAFERAVLADFELVSTSLDHWHPEIRGGRAGRSFFRIEGDPAAWRRSAQAGEEVELRRSAYELR